MTLKLLMYLFTNTSQNKHEIKSFNKPNLYTINRFKSVFKKLSPVITKILKP